MPDHAGAVATLFDEHRAFLWSLGYRLTGNAADADDVVQETFVRALTRPPADRERPWRPWLVHVALNLGRDLLRRRRRRGYDGPWLPSPVEGEPPSHEPADERGDPAARYDLVESVSFAFLLALEALTPMQRAAMLLRDVFDYSVRETAEALGITEANTKTTHLRARRAMAAYEASRRPPTLERQGRTRAALERFLDCVATGDVAGVEAMLADDVRAVSDAGGEFHSNRVPVSGRKKVAALFLGVAKKMGPLVRSEIRTLNGLPAFVGGTARRAGYAPTWVVQAEVDEEGRILRLYTVLASAKLARVASSGIR
jgi:RNA polymerase sigma-70 factor (ECF subfamily)